MKTNEKQIIIVQGDLLNKGFGFVCMELAFKNDIGGTLFYESEKSAILDITGEDKDIKKMIDKCNEENYVVSINTLIKSQTNNKIKDFIILNKL